MHFPQPGEGEWRCACGVGRVGPMHTVYPTAAQPEKNALGYGLSSASAITFPSDETRIQHRRGDPIPQHLFKITFGDDHKGERKVVFNCDCVETLRADGSSRITLADGDTWIYAANGQHLQFEPLRVVEITTDTFGPVTRFVPIAKSWQPIETAPLDGTNILVWGGRPDNYSNELKLDDDTWEYSWPEPRVVTAQYINDRWWYCEYDSGVYGEYLNPIHWMPAPTPPTAKAHIDG
jgi:hypothetical protein